MNKKALSLVQGAMIAALYAVLFYAQDFIFPGTASMAVQFRVAELMCIFALWTPAATRRVAIKRYRFILSAFTHLNNLKMRQYAEYSHILKLPI